MPAKVCVVLGISTAGAFCCLSAGEEAAARGVGRGARAGVGALTLSDRFFSGGGGAARRAGRARRLGRLHRLGLFLRGRGRDGVAAFGVAVGVALGGARGARAAYGATPTATPN